MVRGIRLFFLLCALATSVFADEQTTARRLEELRTNPLLLRRFLEEMPKGGDLHEHLSGAVYAESFLTWAMQDGLCIDRAKLTVANAPCDETHGIVPAKTIASDSTLYSQMIDAMSMRNFHPAAESGHDHFFATFGKFRLLTGQHSPEMLAEVTSRFAAENVDYIESLFGPDFGAARQLGTTLTPGASFAEMRDALLKSGKVADVVADARKALDEIDKRKGSTTVRYLFEVHRAYPRGQFFAELIVGL